MHISCFTKSSLLMCVYVAVWAHTKIMWHKMIAMVISQNLHFSNHNEIIVLSKCITVYTHYLIFTEFTKTTKKHDMLCI